MHGLSYNHFHTDEGDSFITVVVPGRGMKSARSDHPNFKAILAGAMEGDADVIDLFEVAPQVAERFRKLSERVAVRGGTLLFDNDPVDDSVAAQVVAFLDNGVEDWKPLVAFMENVAANPNAHSRSQLYDWLRNQEGLTITAEGFIVGYKGVAKREDGVFTSISEGTAIVDGEVVKGRIPNAVGSVIEMPRQQVVHDPQAYCHRGLHVGTFRFATSWASGAMLEVHVNPRDVVSVPNDASGEKIRVCRYKVVNVIDAPYSGPYRDAVPEDADEDEPQARLAEGTRIQDPDGDVGTVTGWDASWQDDNSGESGAYSVKLDSYGDVDFFYVEDNLTVL